MYITILKIRKHISFYFIFIISQLCEFVKAFFKNIFQQVYVMAKVSRYSGNTGLISLNNMRNVLMARDEVLIDAIMEMNEYSEKYGLTLSKSDAVMLAEVRAHALYDNGRVEFGVGALPKLIEEFCSSSFLTQENYAQTLSELTEAFYYIKSESGDNISDNDLIRLMKDFFESKSMGDLELLQSRDLEAIVRYINLGQRRNLRAEHDDDYSSEPERSEYD